jgi:hypothetical protein
VRFLRNRFKEEFGFVGAHVRVVVRTREDGAAGEGAE